MLLKHSLRLFHRYDCASVIRAAIMLEHTGLCQLLRENGVSPKKEDTRCSRVLDGVEW
jgi:hypothetical protein